MNARVWGWLAFTVSAVWAIPAQAEVFCPSSAYMPCGDGQVYRLVYQTVYDQQQVTAYRVEYETVYEEQQVTRYRPVWETQTQQRRYRVARPVVETSEREERYTVCRPVWETQMQDCSYNRVRYVEETAEREERYTVWRPVWETRQRQECCTVLRPVQQTVYRNECCTVNEPVTTCRTEYVDQGCYAEQMVMKPGFPRTRLEWQPAGWTTDPATGQPQWRRAGLYWVQTPRGRYEVQRVWQPNLVAHQVPQTTYVPRVVTRQVPVQVTSYQPEQVCRTVPYQVCRMVAQECVRKVPYKVCRPVVERVEQQVPVRVCRMVTEQRVRKVPVTTCRTVWEERVEDVPVRVCRMVAYQETIRVPRCVEKRTPVTYTCYVPRTVCCRVPLHPCLVPVQSYAVSDGCCVAEPAEAGARATIQRQPTPADQASPKDAADVKPSLPADAIPGPVDAEAHSAPEGGSPGDTQPEQGRQPAPQSEVYGPPEGSSA